MAENLPSSPPSQPPRSSSAPSSPPRSPRSPPPSVRFAFEGLPAGPSRQPESQVRETGLIAWVESIREEMRREMQAFRENMTRENEAWKKNVQQEMAEELRRLIVEKYLADHKPSSSSESSSLHISDEGTLSQRGQSPTSAAPPPVIPGPSTLAESSVIPYSTSTSMRPPARPPLSLVPSQTQRALRQHAGAPNPFVLPRRPRIGSYYAAIVDTDGDDPDGALLAHMIEIATFRPGFLYSHTGTPEPHRDCCATLYFATIGNVHDWMYDVNHAYRLDNEEMERLQQNSGELKRKRRFDAYIRVCKVEAEDPWEIFERRRP
jgi:hypothetical protein